MAENETKPSDEENKTTNTGIDNLKVLGTKDYHFKDKKFIKEEENNSKKIPQLSFSKKF